MKATLDDLKRIHREAKERWPETVKSERSSRKNIGGVYSRHYIPEAYKIAVGALIVDNNVEEYVEKVNSILGVMLKLYERHDKGENIPLIQDWDFHHHYIFYALAINDLNTAHHLAKRCDPDQLKSSEMHPFNVEFTRLLRHTLLDDKDAALHWAEKFTKRCQTKSHRPYVGYADALQAIILREDNQFASALDTIIADYPKQIASSGIFRFIQHAFVCYYGVGLVHLARWKGLTVNFEHTLIPNKLTSLPEHTFTPPEKPGFIQRLFH